MFRLLLDKKLSQKGISLIEILIGIAVFTLIAFSICQAYVQVMKTVRISRLKVTAAALANEQFEIIRNLSYNNVGIVGGVPSGKMQREKTVTRSNDAFKIITTIRNIDDPFDGTIGGVPNDLAPADYRFVALDISCPSLSDFQTLSFSTYVGPKNLEISSNNGALLIKVFNAVGQAVQGATVHIENNLIVPHIIIDDSTNNSGILEVIDTPVGTKAYEITVTKDGYSQDKTYPITPQNPNPAKPHATVAKQQLTQVSFAIDKTSSLEVSSKTSACSSVENIDYTLQGSKLIGTSPNVLKYSQNHVTNASGIETIGNLEWDTYNSILTDSNYDLAGTIPLVPLVLNPDSTQSLSLIVTPKNSRSLLVAVKDASTQLSLSDASVTLSKSGYSNTLTTGRGFLSQTDWSGGPNQEDFINPAKFSNSDGNIEYTDYPGELRLDKPGTRYSTSGYLVSSTFDLGSGVDFRQILWQPQSQPSKTGQDSIKFQIATNNDKQTWNFLGPDGTAGTFYTLTNNEINSIHNGDRYLRYKVFLSTADTKYTPSVSDVQLTFTSSCVPPGQVMFSGLGSGTYTLSISKPGYQTYTGTVSISSSWQRKEVILNP